MGRSLEGLEKFTMLQITHTPYSSSVYFKEYYRLRVIKVTLETNLKAYFKKGTLFPPFLTCWVDADFHYSFIFLKYPVDCYLASMSRDLETLKDHFGNPVRLVQII